MSRFARLALVALTAIACTAVPAVAQAHNGGGKGRSCARGHVKHGKFLARKACQQRKARPTKAQVIAALKQCGTELAADPEAFLAKYGNRAGGKALERCVRFAIAGAPKEPKPERPVKTLPAVAQAVKDCAAEKAADPEVFVLKYGAENRREAFGRCIREHAGVGPKDDHADAPKEDVEDHADDADKPGDDEGDEHGDDAGTGDTGDEPDED